MLSWLRNHTSMPSYIQKLFAETITYIILTRGVKAHGKSLYNIFAFSARNLSIYLRVHHSKSQNDKAVKHDIHEISVHQISK